ncbi:MAG: hypothetical protein L0Y70_22880, partial [Gemmataceae bacterium]|nr:hypothetical protein [Gemmataceae bacterium]
MNASIPAIVLLCYGFSICAAPAQEQIPAAKKHDLAKLSPQARLVYLSAVRGMDWLQRSNKPDGRFVYGFVPALRRSAEGDNFVHQAGAALSLGRAAKFFSDERGAAVARQALLTLLLETTTDPKDNTVRHTAAPPAVIQRTASAGMLLAAIHELPNPAKDLLDQGDQLANYLRKHLQADGSMLMEE